MDHDPNVRDEDSNIKINSRSSPVVRSLNDLANAKRWVAWREKEHINEDGSTERKKPPYDPHTGKGASINNPATWGTRDQAEQRWQLMQRQQRGVGGTGIMLGALDNGTHLMGIDLDGCRNAKTGELAEWAEEVIERFNSYAEVSPSGEGVKIFFLAADADIAAISELMDNKKRRVFAAGKHREIALDRVRYYTVTGQCFDDSSDLELVDVDDVRWLLEQAGPNFKQQHGAGDSPNYKARDDSGSGHGFRFLLDCMRQGLAFEEACAKLQDDPGPAGEWARRKDERDYEMAWAKAARYVPTHSWDDPDVSLLDDRRGELPAFPLDTIQPDWLRQWIKRAAHGGARRLITSLCRCSASVGV